MSARSVPSSLVAHLPDILRVAVHVEKDCGLDGITPRHKITERGTGAIPLKAALGVRDVANPQGVELPP